MKISPVASGGVPGMDLGNTGRSPDKLAAAKAIAAGDSSIKVFQTETNSNPQSEHIQNIRKIKMRTNVSPDRPIESEVETDGAIIDKTVDETEAADDTKPLSPQFAALAKQRRALQVKERELADREKALESKGTQDGSADFIARLQSQPLRVLQEHGVTYDQLTEAILSSQDGMNPEILELRAELKALKEGVETKFVDRDTQAEQQVLAEMQREAEMLAADGDAFELVRAHGSVPDVMKLIHRTYKETGEVLDVSEAMQLVEDELINEALKVAALKKVQSRIAPAPQPVVQQKQNTIRTLTNRGSSGVSLSRRERAILAMQNGSNK